MKSFPHCWTLQQQPPDRSQLSQNLFFFKPAPPSPPPTPPPPPPPKYFPNGSNIAERKQIFVQRPELDCLYLYCHTASYYTRIIYYTRLYISPTLLPLSMIPNHSLLLLLLVLVIRPLLHPVDRLLPRKLPLLPPHGLGLLLLHHHPFPL